jgi:hypothetical protein
LPRVDYTQRNEVGLTDQIRAKRALQKAVAWMVLIAVVAPIASLWLAVSPARATGSLGPDPADFGGKTMTFQVDNTPYVNVPQIQTLVYFPIISGNSVNVQSAGMTDQGVPQLDEVYSSYSGNPVITTYTLTEISTGLPVAAPCTARAKDATCTFGPFNLPPSSVVDTRSGFFVVRLVATLNIPPGAVVHNGFIVQASTGGVVGFDSKSPATSFAMEEAKSDWDYADWHLKFGSDCTVPPGGQSAQVTYFDPDNGRVNQPITTNFSIWDYTGVPFKVRITGLSGDDVAAGATLNAASDTVTPSSGDGTTGIVTFTAFPNHIYQLIWPQVYSNNALQFQLPYDSIYYISRGCKLASYTITPALTIAGSPAFLEPGKTYSLNAIASASAGPTSAFTMALSNTSTGIPWLQTSGITISPPSSWGGLSFVSPGVISRSGTNNLVMSALIPDIPGLTACFTNTVDHANELGTPASAQLCLPVYRVKSPSVVGLNGDIHAGGGICGQLLSNGRITGSPGGASFGDYMVASSGLISKFKSNGAAGADDLALGAAGNYSQACRPDLLAPALAGRTGSSAVIPGAGKVTVDLTSLTGPGKPNVYYFDGDDLAISGTVHTKVTIVITKNVAKAHIAGLILLDPTPALARYAPSVGIISAGDIAIDPIVTRVDAYLFSNGDIDTCEGAVPNSTKCATPQLVVNGFLMGKSIQLNRLEDRP